MITTEFQRSIVERIHARRPGRAGAPRPLAEQAAVYARHYHVTRDRAARIFGVSSAAVDAAFSRLYPNVRRVRT